MRTVINTIGLLCLSSVVALAQTPSEQLLPQLTTEPQLHAAPAVRQAFAVNYPRDHTVFLKFKGTERSPKAEGQAKVERKEGRTEIEMKVENMRPATLFGGDFNTYVLWVVSPEGQIQNVGEFILNGDDSKLTATTTLGTFAMFVTAEPHYLVNLPSRFIVLDTVHSSAENGGLQLASIPYRGFEGVYNFDRESLIGAKEAKGPVNTDVKQAWTSVQLAKHAGADVFAKAELDKAQRALDGTLALSQSRRNLPEMDSKARETVRLAVAAEVVAQKRSVEAALASERAAQQARQETLEQKAQNATTDAERARLESERSQLAAEQEANARLMAEQQAQLQAERAQDAKAQTEDAKAQVEVERQKTSALEGQLAQANQQAQQASMDRQKAFDQMKDSLGRIADTRETARGLIVSIPDVLFDTNSATMRPEGRENMSKIAGIIMATPGSWNISVEGHTDNTGGAALNQDLSERRAEAVRGYLISNGVARDSVTAQGFGMSKPIATNDSASGRQRNRRVEIVIEAPVPQQ